jgi:hypothetical protein
MPKNSKVDAEKLIFCGKRLAKEGTVFDTFRKAVGNDGLTYEQLKTYLTESWTPLNSETYGPGYIRAYVTGGIKEDYLTQDENLKKPYAFRPRVGKAKEQPKVLESAE